MIEEFWDDESGGFFFTGKSHENLIVRSKDYFDNATPSGNSVAAMRPAATRDCSRITITTEILPLQFCGKSAIQARRYPSGFGYALSAVDFLLSTPKEVAIVGKDAERHPATAP